MAALLQKEHSLPSFQSKFDTTIVVCNGKEKQAKLCYIFSISLNILYIHLITVVTAIFP